MNSSRKSFSMKKCVAITMTWTDLSILYVRD